MNTRDFIADGPQADRPLKYLKRVATRLALGVVLVLPAWPVRADDEAVKRELAAQYHTVTVAFQKKT